MPTPPARTKLVEGKDLAVIAMASLVCLLLSVLGIQAHRLGHPLASALLGAAALMTAVTVAATLLPRLWRQARPGSVAPFERRNYVRFTRRGTFFILTVGAIAFASVNSGNNMLILVLSVLLASLIVSGLVAKSVLSGLKVSLSLPNDIYAKRKVVFYLTLINLKQRLPSFAVGLHGQFRNGAGEQAAIDKKLFPFVRPGAQAKLRMECRFPNRGIYSVDGLHVTTVFPFGFFLRGRVLPVEGHLVVFPRLSDLGWLWQIHPHMKEGRRESPRMGIGGSLYNIRPYRHGDRARFVHWKSTAKLGRLMVKDFALEEDRPLEVVFSTSLPSAGPRGKAAFEAAVSAVASLANHYRRRQRRFTLLSENFQATVDGRRGDYVKLMQYLAQVQPTVNSRPFLPSEGEGIFFAAGDFPAPDGFILVNYLTLPIGNAPENA